MEALYEKAIAKLQDRVASLEAKASLAAVRGASAGPQRKSVVVVTPPPPSNQVPERANIGGPQRRASTKTSGSGAVPAIGRLVPGARATTLPSGLR